MGTGAQRRLSTTGARIERRRRRLPCSGQNRLALRRCAAGGGIGSAWLAVRSGGLPVFGYAAAIAALLLGAVLLVPAVTMKGLGWAPRTHRIVLDTAVSQLRRKRWRPRLRVRLQELWHQSSSVSA